VAVVAWLGSTLDEAVRLPLELVVTEMVTNAVLHAGGDFELVVERSHGAITIDVMDASGAPPVVEHAAGLGETGRGLYLVAALADDWGYQMHPTGKTVWAQFQLPGEARRARWASSIGRTLRRFPR
jgi:anti-sigma regulatory factor (Ser/Thr protein kinase)